MVGSNLGPDWDQVSGIRPEPELVPDRSFTNNLWMRCATVILMPNSDLAWNITSIRHFLPLFRIFVVRFQWKSEIWAYIVENAEWFCGILTKSPKSDPRNEIPVKNYPIYILLIHRSFVKVREHMLCLFLKKDTNQCYVLHALFNSLAREIVMRGNSFQLQKLGSVSIKAMKQSFGNRLGTCSGIYNGWEQFLSTREALASGRDHLLMLNAKFFRTLTSP